MRAFSRNRRKLIKPHYVRGLKKTMTGTSKVTLENAIDAHIPYLEITGKTAQNGTPTPEAPIPIQNANDNGIALNWGGISIVFPTSIDVNGTSVSLLFSEYDKLTVDRLNNKVVYSQGSIIYFYTGDETGNRMQIVSGNGNNYRSFIESLGFWGVSCINDVGYCTHFKKASWSPLSAYGTYATRTNDVIFRTDGVQTLDEFRAFLKEQYENGTPVTIVKQRQTSIEHDITKTELGQALLSLATRQGTNYLEIVGDLEPSAINVTYYSESEQDQVNLTIKYMCEDREIKDPRVQEIRKGSKYLIVAPHIDGYTRISSEVYGVADENTTIELIYKEEEDATI